jgi:hypothetical protein
MLTFRASDKDLVAAVRKHCELNDGEMSMLASAERDVATGKEVGSLLRSWLEVKLPENHKLKLRRETQPVDNDTGPDPRFY